MSLSGTKKSPLISVPFLKKRLRRISTLGVHNLTVNEFNFTVHFTLHRNERTVAFYTSELLENQRSPEWSYLKFPLNVQCLQDFLMRIWITSSNHCRLFLEYDIHLDDSLIPDEQKETIAKMNNTLWLEIFGYRFTDNDQEQILPLSTKQRIYSTKSYDKPSIIRMNNVLHAIRTENQTSAIYLEQIEICVEGNKDYLAKIKERESRQVRIETLKQYLRFRTYLNQQRSMTHQQKQRILEERKYQLNQNLSQKHLQQEEINAYHNHLNQSKIFLRNIIQIINYRQKEIINQIYQYIYPIEHENYRGYSIANLNLPQAEDKIYQSASTRERDHEIAAAISYCSHFILIISQFIQLPLRFPIDYHGIPIMKIYDYNLDINEFPLYPTTNLSDFRYGFYLLNRNIGQMMYHCRVGGQNTHLQNTLENLKELIEEYFIHSNTNNQIQLYPSLQTIKSADTMNESIILNKQTSITSSCSSTFSPIETNDDDIKELFPQFNPAIPRLAMEISHQIQY